MNTISVTQIINNFKKFDREFWLAYKALEVVMPTELFALHKTLILKSKRVDTSILDLVDIEQYELAKAEIDAQWKAENEESKRLGVEVHLMMLSILADNEADKIAFGILGTMACSDFMKSSSGVFIELRLELPIDEFTIIGIPDVIEINDGVVNLIDWKTAKKGIKFKSHYDMALNLNKKMLYPLNSIDDVNGQHYTLLLSLYMWIIQLLRPDLSAGTLKISWIENGKLKKSFEVPYMEKEVADLVKWYIRDLKTKRAIQECNTLVF